MIKLVTVAAVRATYQKPTASVDVNDDAQAAVWARRLSVSRDQLMAAVEAVGPSVAAIRGHLIR